MSGNSFGEIFRVTTFGESHGGAVGAVVDGCPPGMALDAEDVQVELDRRRPGQSAITSQRQEKDRIQILSGVFEGKTTGTPILLIAGNDDARPEDYTELKNVFRPGHADFTYLAKYGVRDWRGSGRASARETLARVAAGAIARKYLREKFGIEIIGFVEQVEDIIASDFDIESLTRLAVDSTIVRCPDPGAALKMIARIEEVKAAGDSVGGVIRGIARNVPPGLGEPVFDKLHAELGKAMLSINAVKGFSIGAGFEAARMRGSQHNDPFVSNHGRTELGKNDAGGVLGGISTGQPIDIRVAFKPVSTILKAQSTVNLKGEAVVLAASGRHDPCVLPRAVPIVEAMMALVLLDHTLRQRAIRN